jgi:hypothetical protein
MEKFYTINKDIDLYREYFQYWNDANKLNRIVKKFLPEQGIESDQYYSNGNGLWIVPTDNDKVKFAKQLSKKEESQGLRQFKANSNINKSWNLVLDGFIPTWKPIVQFYFGGGRGARYRLFHKEDILYCSFEAPYDFKNPEGFTEMSGSEFYKVIEECK